MTVAFAHTHSAFCTLDMSLNPKKILFYSLYFPIEKAVPGMDSVIQENFEFKPQLDPIAGEGGPRLYQNYMLIEKRFPYIIIKLLPRLLL